MLLSPLGRARGLFLDLGRYGTRVGPLRRALVEPAAILSDDALSLLICDCGRCLGAAGLIAGTCGNLSARCRSRNFIWITRTGANKSRLRAIDLRRIPLSASAEVDRDISCEFPMHRACYVVDASIGAVIHTHAPGLTALGIRDVDLDAVLPEAASSVGGVSRIPYLPSGSEQLAAAVGEAVSAGAHLLLLQRHGAVAVGRTLNEAADRMELGELSARAVLLAAE